MTKQQLSQLNPDAFSRFQIVSNEVKAAFGNRRIKVLDIGGASTYLFDFFKANGINFELTIVDIVDYPGKPKEAKLIIQSAENLSFKDSSFDLVVGIDMLEHIPTVSMKQNIINEAIRVSGNLVIFAGPFETPQVTRFEESLNVQNNLLFGMDQRWLAEHFKYGKPTKKLLKDSFTAAEIEPLIFSALPLSEWYVSSLANLMPATTDSIPLNKINKLNTAYNEQFLKKGYSIPDIPAAQEGYRSFFIGAKNRKLVDKSVVDNRAPSRDMFAENYIDAIIEGLYKTRDHAALKEHLSWYKAEHKRLDEENEELRLENQSLKLSLERARGPIARSAKRIKKRMHSEDVK